MSTRELHGVVDWRLGPYDAPGVPVAIFQAECMTCHEQSEPSDNDGKRAQNWGFRHVGRHPDHRVIKLHTETYWQFTPGPGNPYAEAATGPRSPLA